MQMIKTQVSILIRNPYTYLLVHLCTSYLSIGVYLQVSPPLFVEELKKDHHREKVMPNLVRTFGATVGQGKTSPSTTINGYKRQ